MSASVLSWTRATPNGDWTNSELAELYRVEHALVQASFRFESERGVSDEGDPWFVFCAADGRVVVHITRLKGIYRFSSPGLDAPLTGPSFTTLTKTFVRDISPVPVQSRGERVIAHPSAL